MNRFLQTSAVRAGVNADLQHGAVMPPLHLSSNFSFEGFRQPRRYDYTRSGNPTRDVLAEALAELEGGARGIVTSTGMSAITLITQLLKPGDLLIATHDCYGGTHRLFSALARKGQFEVAFLDLAQPAALQEIGTRKPSLVWIETPSNPLLRITDVAEVCQAAHRVNALAVVDNTFLSPVWQRPFELGADLVIHSTTKYLNGHSDVVGGAVIAKTSELGDQLAWWANCLGITGAPFDSYLTLRGIRSLHARLRQHQENAQTIVELLRCHPAVRTLYHPSLPTHPGHEIAKRQQLGYGAMVSFELIGGENQVIAFLNGLEHFTLAESLGGVESLVAHPTSMTHAAMEPEARVRAGIRESLLRISVGIEAKEDLCSDLELALERAVLSIDSRKERASERAHAFTTSSTVCEAQPVLV